MSEKSTGELITRLVVGVSAFLATGLLYGWVLSVLWSWYLVPHLRMPPIGVIQGTGITLLVGLLVYTAPSRERLKDDDTAFRLACHVVNALMILGIGWLFHLFM